MDISKPLLIEPGVKYFLKETLKQCKNKKNDYYYYWVNIGLFLLFLLILGSSIIWKKKTKPSKEDLILKHEQQKKYILEKINGLQKAKEKENNRIITNLPKFESNFERIHKNYYKV
jgi:hypothetical protein